LLKNHAPYVQTQFDQFFVDGSERLILGGSNPLPEFSQECIYVTKRRNKMADKSDELTRIVVEVSGGTVRLIHSDSDRISIDVPDDDNTQRAGGDPEAREEYEYYLGKKPVRASRLPLQPLTGNSGNDDRGNERAGSEALDRESLMGKIMFFASSLRRRTTLRYR
jgi:hypothetical protein